MNLPVAEAVLMDPMNEALNHPVAQEVAQVIPDAVSTHNLSEYGKLSDFKMLSYEKVFIHTIGAIQSLIKSNQELNARIVELEKK